MSREPIQLHPETPEPNGAPHEQPPDDRETRVRASGICALVAVSCFSVAVVLGWGLIGLLIVVGVFALLGAVLFALPRRPRS